MAKKVFGNEVGPWTELKLEYIKKYLEAYSNILRSTFPEYYFIDAFASSGFCKKRKTRELIYGSPLIALNIQPPFTKYFFIELNKNKADCLESERKNNYSNLDAKIKNGDCNIIIDSILSYINDSIPFIALLDPQAGDLYWETIHKISQKKKVEVLINFPFGMAIRRYMPLTKGKNITKNMKNKLNRIFGDDNWEKIYLERKKNTAALVEAFALWKENNPDSNLKLLLVGNAGFGFDEINYIIEEFNLSKEVLMPGWVSAVDLPYIVAAAKAFISPSRYEGFGITLLESLACGVPTAVSNLPVFKEVAGDAVLYFDQNDKKSMVMAIDRVVNDEGLRQELKTKGLARAHQFSWRKCASETKDLLTSL